MISSSYILPLRYLENELFVDSSQCSDEEFPVVVMEWVEGDTLDAYLNRNLNDKYELEMLSYRFNRMAAWLLSQPFAHGDLKPDNILVRKDGSLVLVDYDGMFVPSMKGEKAREIGSPDYRHPSRTDSDFNEHIDDFSIATIALSLKSIALNSILKLNGCSSNALLLSENDYRKPSNSRMLKEIQNLMDDSQLASLFGVFSIALTHNSLNLISPKLLSIQENHIIKEHLLIQATKITKKDIEDGIEDEHRVIYSKDGKRLIKGLQGLRHYSVKEGTEIICDEAFSWSDLESINLPSSIKAIGDEAFNDCIELKNIVIPNSTSYIGNFSFNGCSSIESLTIPN